MLTSSNLIILRECIQTKKRKASNRKVSLLAFLFTFKDYKADLFYPGFLIMFGAEGEKEMSFSLSSMDRSKVESRMINCSFKKENAGRDDCLFRRFPVDLLFFLNGQ